MDANGPASQPRPMLIYSSLGDYHCSQKRRPDAKRLARIGRCELLFGRLFNTRAHPRKHLLSLSETVLVDRVILLLPPLH